MEHTLVTASRSSKPSEGETPSPGYTSTKRGKLTRKLIGRGTKSNGNTYATSLSMDAEC
uniref:Uncharacterized protein n=1 Tax=Solanum tuberosum TaxID=4113 RepID=M1B299_SOLTU